MEDSDRTRLACFLAGGMFIAGWWILGDAAGYARYTNDAQEMKGEFFVPAIVGILGLVMLNSFPWDNISNAMDENQGKCAKLLLFSSLVVIVGCFFGAVVILARVYTGPNSHADSSYGGVAILLQQILNVLSALTLRFGRAHGNA